MQMSVSHHNPSLNSASAQPRATPSSKRVEVDEPSENGTRWHLCCCCPKLCQEFCSSTDDDQDTHYRHHDNLNTNLRNDNHSNNRRRNRSSNTNLNTNASTTETYATHENQTGDNLLFLIKLFVTLGGYPAFNEVNESYLCRCLSCDNAKCMKNAFRCVYPIFVLFCCIFNTIVTIIYSDSLLCNLTIIAVILMQIESIILFYSARKTLLPRMHRQEIPELEQMKQENLRQQRQLRGMGYGQPAPKRSKKHKHKNKNKNKNKNKSKKINPNLANGLSQPLTVKPRPVRVQQPVVKLFNEHEFLNAPTTSNTEDESQQQQPQTGDDGRRGINDNNYNNNYNNNKKNKNNGSRNETNLNRNISDFQRNDKVVVVMGNQAIDGDVDTSLSRNNNINYREHTPSNSTVIQKVERRKTDTNIDFNYNDNSNLLGDNDNNINKHESKQNGQFESNLGYRDARSQSTMSKLREEQKLRQRQKQKEKQQQRHKPNLNTRRSRSRYKMSTAQKIMSGALMAIDSGHGKFINNYNEDDDDDDDDENNDNANDIISTNNSSLKPNTIASRGRGGSHGHGHRRSSHSRLRGGGGGSKAARKQQLRESMLPTIKSQLKCELVIAVCLVLFPWIIGIVTFILDGQYMKNGIEWIVCLFASIIDIFRYLTLSTVLLMFRIRSDCFVSDFHRLLYSFKMLTNPVMRKVTDPLHVCTFDFCLSCMQCCSCLCCGWFYCILGALNRCCNGNEQKDGKNNSNADRRSQRNGKNNHNSRDRAVSNNIVMQQKMQQSLNSNINTNGNESRMSLNEAENTNTNTNTNTNVNDEFNYNSNYNYNCNEFDFICSLEYPKDITSIEFMNSMNELTENVRVMIGHFQYWLYIFLVTNVIVYLLLIVATIYLIDDFANGNGNSDHVEALNDCKGFNIIHSNNGNGNNNDRLNSSFYSYVHYWSESLFFIIGWLLMVQSLCESHRILKKFQNAFKRKVAIINVQPNRNDNGNDNINENENGDGGATTSAAAAAPTRSGTAVTTVVTNVNYNYDYSQGFLEKKAISDYLECITQDDSPFALKMITGASGYKDLSYIVVLAFVTVASEMMIALKYSNQF